MNECLEEKTEAPVKKIVLADTAGNVSYSLLVGSVLDYLSGLNLAGIATSRAYATAVNSVTGGPYGWWREKTFKATRTTEESKKVRKTLTDLLAFNTFQVPIYATAIAVGSLVSEGKIDWDKVKKGSIYLTAISPFIGPTMGWWMDKIRRVLKIKPAAEGAYEKGLSFKEKIK